MAANIATSLISTLVRGTTGISSRPASEQPAKLLELYDIENCPYCRLAREAITELNLDVIIRPCPKTGERFRPELEQRGGKAQFPYLVDPNTGVEMYESLDIVAYLFETYGDGEVPLKWRAGGLQTFGSMIASGVRMGRGMKLRGGEEPQQMLELYSFESSPYARPVKELLCEMEIPYIVRSCGRSQLSEWVLPPVRAAFNIEVDSDVGNRQWLQMEEGKVSIPYLYDPNTGDGMFESERILQHLEDNYASA